MIACRHLNSYRLGNSLFMLSSALGVAASRGDSCRFPADWRYRRYFSLPDDMFGSIPSDVIELADCPELAHIDMRARGYAQDTGLFVDILPAVREHLAPSPLVGETLHGPLCAGFEALPRPILSVHVRRGDNVPGADPGVANKWDYMLLPPESYYRDAISLLRDGCASVAAFSDDPQWVTDRLGDVVDYVHWGEPHPKEDRADFLTAPVRDWPDLFMMAACDGGHVVTGSTYGIMAALLADSPRVVRSTPVYGPALPYIDESLLFPPGWRCLEHPVEVPAC